MRAGFELIFAAVSLVILSVILTSCGANGLFSESTPNSMEYSMEGVKLIAEEIPSGNSASTFLQESYVVGPSRRLLMRFENLSEHLNAIRVDDTNKVELKIRLASDSEPSLARTAMRVCPLKRTWMMLATWSYAHPFGQSGTWQNPGGDYDPSECVAADAPTLDGNGQPLNPETLVFNVSQWFVNYARGRGENQGLLLNSDASLTVYGDRSGQYSPRLLWKENTWLAKQTVGNQEPVFTGTKSLLSGPR